MFGSKTNHRYMSKSLMLNKISELQNKLVKQELYIKNLEKKIENDHRMTIVDEELHHNLLSIMQDHNQSIIDNCPENSFAKIFWDNQYKAASQKSCKQFRWHPAIIRWCIFLHHKSSKAYELLRKTGILYLPTQRTLRDYTHAYSSTLGFSAELDMQLIKDACMSTLQPFQKHVSLIADEMYIKEGLVYNKHNGQLIGYCNIGEINNHLISLEQEYKGDTATKELASAMLVLMVRGLFTSFTFPYATFATSTLTGEQLVPIFYEALFRLERCGFKVTSITMDGNSVNRKFYKLVGSNSTTPKSIAHKFSNPLDKSRQVLLFSDPPHLIKTARNYLQSSKRNMEVN